MQCEQCGHNLTETEAYNHLGRTLCEDCYMEALSPVKACDPWAVHSAKNFEQHSGGQSTLTSIQKEILAILEESGGLTMEEVGEKLGGKLDAEALRREFATLRHMEKTRAEKRDGAVVMCLW